MAGHVWLQVTQVPSQHCVSGGTGGQVPFQGTVDPSQHWPGGGSTGHVDVKGITDPSQQDCISTGRPPFTVNASEIVTTSSCGVNRIPRRRSAGSHPVVSTTPDHVGRRVVFTVNLISVKSPELLGNCRTCHMTQKPVSLTP